jgi:hypothetical protein
MADARPALRQPEQSQAGLRLDPGFERATEGLFGSGEIPATKPELAKLVGSCSDPVGDVVLGEVLAGRRRLLLGFCPSTLKPQYLGAVDTTITSPPAWQGRSLTPLLETSCPLARATHFQKVTAGADRPAVHTAGRGRPQVARRCGRCCLVDQRPALFDLAIADEHGPLVVERHDLEISVAELLRYLERPPQLLPRLVEIAPSIRSKPMPTGEVPVFWHSGSSASSRSERFDQPAATEPARAMW